MKYRQEVRISNPVLVIESLRHISKTETYEINREITYGN